MITFLLQCILSGLIAGIVAWTFDLFVNKFKGQLIFEEEEGKVPF